MLLATGAIRWLMFTLAHYRRLVAKYGNQLKGRQGALQLRHMRWCSTQMLGGRADLDGGKRA